MVIYISLGIDCCVGYQLNKLNLKKETMPFDWSYSKNILDIIDIFETNWIHFINIDNWIIETITNDNYSFEFTNTIKSKYKLKHKFYKLIYPHDLLENNINHFIDKYIRRINRLMLLNKEEIIFIRLGTNKDLPHLNKLNQVLKNKFSNSSLKFINSLDYQCDDWMRNNIPWNIFLN